MLPILKEESSYLKGGDAHEPPLKILGKTNRFPKVKNEPSYRLFSIELIVSC